MRWLSIATVSFCSPLTNWMNFYFPFLQLSVYLINAYIFLFVFVEASDENVVEPRRACVPDL